MLEIQVKKQLALLYRCHELSFERMGSSDAASDTMTQLLTAYGCFAEYKPITTEEDMAMKSKCEKCKFRSYAERKPNSLLARLWRWHTGWCPGWKSYQRELAEQATANTP